MDKFLTKYNDFKFYSIHPDSNWWNEIISFGYKCDKEFVPPLSERMPIEEYFKRFRNDRGFTILAAIENEFVGCLCNFFHHPETNKPWYQCIIINEKFRQNKLTEKFYDLSENILREKGELFIKGRTWVENFKSRKALVSKGFYLVDTLINDRSEGVHTVIYEKCLFKTKYFTRIKHLGILGGMGSNASANFLSNICVLTSQTKLEQDQLPISLYSVTDTPDRTELILAGRKEELIKLLEKQIRDLGKNNVSHIIICCFSYHSIINEIDISLRKQVVSLIDYTIALLKIKKGKYLSLGTNASYKLQLLKEADNVFYPIEEDQLKIHDCIYRIKRGEPKELILFDIEAIIARYECTGVVLACTEFSLVADKIEIDFKNLDILNPLKVISYDVADSWKEVNQRK